MNALAHEWTDQRKLDVIAKLAQIISDAADDRGEEELYDVAETIIYVATQPAAQLQEHRDQILRDARMFPSA